MFRLAVSRISLILVIQLVGCDNGNPPPSTTTQATPKPSNAPRTFLTAALVIDRVELYSHPRTGPWLMCFQAKAGEAKSTFNVARKTYRGNRVSIGMGLQLSPIEASTPVNFSLLMDDDPARVCGADAKDRSTEIFAAGTGDTTVKRDKFHYVIHYHMRYKM